MPWVPLILIVLVLLGAPLFAVIATSAIVGFHGQGTDLSVIASDFFQLSETPVLVAIPLFTYAGFVLSAGEAPRRLVRLSQALLGWFPGGLAIVTLVSCALFTAFTGASGVTIIALGSLFHPALMQAGYEERFSLGLNTASGSLGLLFAPSLPLILYGVVAMAPIDDLFVAGVLPGVLILLMLTAYSYWRNRGARYALTERSGREVWAAIKGARWDLPLPVVVLGGIYSGYFAVSEAAAVTALYVTIVELAVLREVKWRALPGIMRESMVLVGAIFIILGVSLASTSYMIDAGVPQALFASVSSFVTGPRSFLLVLLVFLLILGAILDIFSATVLVVPLILPIAAQYGIDSIHYAMVILLAMGIGIFIPPIGICFYISCAVAESDVEATAKTMLPYLAILIVGVLAVAFVPWFTHAVPKLLGAP